MIHKCLKVSGVYASRVRLRV